MTTAASAGHIGLGRQRSPKNHTGSNVMPYLRVANVFEDRIEASDVMTMHFEPDEFERYRLVCGDILLNEGQSPEFLGRPAIYRGRPSNVAFTNSLIRFKAGPGVLPEWALIVFRHHMHTGRFARESRITTNIAHLSANRFATTEFPIPPIEEQRRIVNELERVLSHVDAAERSLATAQARIVSARNAILWSAVLPNGPEVDEATELPTLPDGWSWSTLGSVAEIAGGVTKDSKRQDDVQFVEVPYLRVANVQRGFLDLDVVTTIRVHPDKAKALRLEVGDVLFNEGGDRDKLGRGWVWEGQVADCIHQNHVFRARLTDDRLHPKFVSWFGNTFGKRWFGANGKQTTNLASINLSTLRTFPIPVPTEGSLDGVIDEVERRLTLLDAATRSVTASKARCAHLRKSFLISALRGTLVPQDPSVTAANAPIGTSGAEPASRPTRSKPSGSKERAT